MGWRTDILAFFAGKNVEPNQVDLRKIAWKKSKYTISVHKYNQFLYMIYHTVSGVTDSPEIIIPNNLKISLIPTHFKITNIKIGDIIRNVCDKEQI